MTLIITISVHEMLAYSEPARQIEIMMILKALVIDGTDEAYGNWAVNSAGIHIHS
jgi:hypothetical protein